MIDLALGGDIVLDFNLGCVLKSPNHEILFHPFVAPVSPKTASYKVGCVRCRLESSRLYGRVLAHNDIQGVHFSSTKMFSATKRAAAAYSVRVGQSHITAVSVTYMCHLHFRLNTNAPTAFLPFHIC